eukprot:CAMPEP_0185848658 /NCGR_PEP_ID=MMETSP1354-20130828/3448_1 /TAXON_ID=708628 /ORGANISM="Erythrolobus madagascarensis, Strain CCMP3276" /LENGTH=418 /DNA_ID=CAMNT_0028549073 /DNA_START=337 /DNA_END=1593 /DNA_ORIENTATION=-
MSMEDSRLPNGVPGVGEKAVDDVTNSDSDTIEEDEDEEPDTSGAPPPKIVPVESTIEDEEPPVIPAPEGDMDEVGERVNTGLDTAAMEEEEEEEGSDDEDDDSSESSERDVTSGAPQHEERSVPVAPVPSQVEESEEEDSSSESSSEEEDSSEEEEVAQPVEPEAVKPRINTKHLGVIPASEDTTEKSTGSQTVDTLKLSGSSECKRVSAKTSYGLQAAAHGTKILVAARHGASKKMASIMLRDTHQGDIVDLEFSPSGDRADPIHVLAASSRDGLAALYFLALLRDPLEPDVVTSIKLVKCEVYETPEETHYRAVKLIGSSTKGTLALVPAKGSKIRLIRFSTALTYPSAEEFASRTAAERKESTSWEARKKAMLATIATSGGTNAASPDSVVSSSSEDEEEEEESMAGIPPPPPPM